MTVEHITELLMHYRYWILLPLAIVEGPVLALFVGILVKLNYLSFIPALIVMICGDYIPDTFYYHLGRYGANWKFFKKVTTKLNDQSLIIRLWNTHRLKTLFMSKLAFGLAPALLVTAGVAKVPYKFFIRWALLITVVQYGAFMTIGYTIGYSYHLVQDVKYFGMLVAAIIVLVFGINTAVKKYAKKEIENMEHEVK